MVRLIKKQDALSVVGGYAQAQPLLCAHVIYLLRDEIYDIPEFYKDVQKPWNSLVKLQDVRNAVDRHIARHEKNRRKISEHFYRIANKIEDIPVVEIGESHESDT